MPCSSSIKSFASSHGADECPYRMYVTESLDSLPLSFHFFKQQPSRFFKSSGRWRIAL